MKEQTTQYLRFPEQNYRSLADNYARYIEKKQLTDASLWRKFVNVFVDRSDISDDGWRGEYWGKMMRGACMTYAYTHSEELYRVLTDAVQNLLAAQDDAGRISGYTPAHEFCGWDMWGRKYVLVGLAYYYEICRDLQFKERILCAMRRHADYITENVGDSTGKIHITDTSDAWGGLNSCTILEPMLQLYKLTGEERYLQFGEYIISTGGSKDGNLIACVKSGKKPFEFPVTKAYEIMSFFEGLLAYYEITEKREYLNVAETFAEAVYESDITLIGCAGCTHELFDHSAAKQTEYSETIMQETCVTVTWMRLCARLWENIFDAKYIDRIEQSALNALFGSINTHELPQHCYYPKYAMTPALPFDSYSPLYNNTRGRGVGGYKEFPEGEHYGCCACIGSAGTALYPLYAAVKRSDVFYVNFYMTGEMRDGTPSGQNLRIASETDYPAAGTVRLVVTLPRPERLKIAVRIPGWCENATVTCGNETFSPASGYLTLDRVWRDGDTVEIRLPITLKKVTQKGKTAFTYGALTLARDEAKEDGDITALSLADGPLQYEMDNCRQDEQVRLTLKTDDGNVLLTDYASCGKHWNLPRNRITVWMNF